MLYGIFIVAEMVLHTLWSIRYRKRADETLSHANRTNLKLVLLLDILQFPLSLIFTRFLNLFSSIIPDLQTVYAGSFAGSFAGRLLFLLLALILTGIGAAISLDMRIIPNPGDGIVQAIADCKQKCRLYKKLL